MTVSQQMRKIINALLFLLILSLVATPGVGQARQSLPVAQGPDTTPPTQPDAVKIYLPFAQKAKNTPNLIAAEIIYGGSDTYYTSKATAANIKWSRTTVISWKDIEPTRTNPPTYNWSKVNEASLKGLSSAGIKTIAIVKYAPVWAQQTPGSGCGPILASALDEYAQFLTAVVQRYSVAPYNVHYWEMGNEPDTGLFMDDANGPHIFGCWGDPNDPYFGGRYYGQMLEYATPAIKAADQSAQVAIGGLLLNCDPAHPPAGDDCKSSLFLEGILVYIQQHKGLNAIHDYLDIVSYHGYPGYDGTMLVDENYPTWSARGGLSIGKANYLKELMAKYGVSLPLFHSEGAMLCPESDYYKQWCSNPSYGNGPIPAFFEAQADYIVWLYVRDWANGMWATSWYQFEGPGWRYSGLLDTNQNPKKVYYALQFMTTELSSSKYIQQIFSYSNVRAYEFSNSSKRVWVMWSPDGQNHTITLPAGTIKVLDKYGTVLTPSNNQLTINSPVYVELPL
jgi:hypothetical protein